MADDPAPIQQKITNFIQDKPSWIFPQVWIRWFQNVARRLLGLEDTVNVLLRMAPTGMIDPENTGQVSINADDDTLIDFTACQLQFVDAYTDPANPTLTIVDVPAQIGVTVDDLATDAVTFLYLDINGEFVFEGTLRGQDFLRDHVGAGILTHPNRTSLEGAEQASLVSISNTTMSHADQSFCQLGISCSFGGRNIISGSSGVVGVDTTGGCWYYHGINSGFDNKNPNIIEAPALTQFSMLIGWRTTDGDGQGLTIANVIGTGANGYDDGTALQADGAPQGLLNNNQWTNNRIFKIVNENRPLETQFVMQYGQVKYNSSAAALAAIQSESFDILDTFLAVAPNATVTMRGGALDLSIITDAVFTQANPPRATF